MIYVLLALLPSVTGYLSFVADIVHMWLLFEQMADMENRYLKQLGWKGEGLVSAAQDPFYKGIVQQ